MGKKDFLLEFEYRRHFDLLADAELGKLLRAIYDYEEFGTEPALKGKPQMAFSFIRVGLDMRRERYLSTCERNKKNGKMGGRPTKENGKNPDKPNGYFGLEKKPNETHGNPKKPDIDLDLEGLKKESPKGDKKKLNPPSLAEVEAYAKEKGSPVDYKFFHAYFQDANWIDSKGKPVLSWKQKFLTWDKREREKNPPSRVHDEMPTQKTGTGGRVIQA